MSLKAFRKPQQSTPDGKILADNMADFTRQLVNNPLLAGVLVKDVELDTVKVIPHGLNRRLQGWIITRLKNNVTIYESGTLESTDKYLTLTASATATVDVYIF